MIGWAVWFPKFGLIFLPMYYPQVTRVHLITHMHLDSLQLLQPLKVTPCAVLAARSVVHE